MYNVITITLPFFLLIFVGSFLNYYKFLNADSARLLAKIAFYLLMPPMIFLNLANSNPIVFLNFKFLLLYELGTIILFLLAIPIGLFFKLQFNSIGMFGLISSYPNYGYIGIPMTFMALGPASASPMALILFSNTFMLLFLTSVYMALHEGRASLKLSSLSVIKNLFSNPLILSVIAGISFASLSLNIPRPIDTTFSMLAKAAAPIALISLGASLRIKNSNSGLSQVFSITFIKLLVHPILIFTIFIVFPGQEKLWIQTAIICSCLPVAANVFVLASNYNKSIYESTNAIFFSTLLSSMTVPTILFILLDTNYFS